MATRTTRTWRGQRWEWSTGCCPFPSLRGPATWWSPCRRCSTSWSPPSSPTSPPNVRCCRPPTNSTTHHHFVLSFFLNSSHTRPGGALPSRHGPRQDAGLHALPARHLLLPPQFRGLHGVCPGPVRRGLGQHPLLHVPARLVRRGRRLDLLYCVPASQGCPRAQRTPSHRKQFAAVAVFVSCRVLCVLCAVCPTTNVIDHDWIIHHTGAGGVGQQEPGHVPCAHQAGRPPVLPLLRRVRHQQQGTPDLSCGVPTNTYLPARFCVCF